MGDVRHFGDHRDSFASGGRGPMGDGLPGAAEPPRPLYHVSRPTPVEEAPDAIARIVEAEILPRLMLAHRRPARRAAAERGPSPEAISAFSAMLLAPGPVDIDAEAAALRDGGLPLPRLLLDLLAPAARHLGELWEDDTCDFLAVTEALGRLQAISRRLCVQLEDESVPAAGRSVLLLACPGETHLFGLSIVASFFREAGWDVTTASPGPGPDPASLLREGWFDVVGLSLSCEAVLPALAATVPLLRRASRNPDLRVIVGGPYFAAAGTEAVPVDVDACVLDGRQAPGVAEALLDRRAVAC